ncbi:BZ3500_MvSof-1268-A1-R1_Chr8-1g09839 [Microbotryum saponariae]|uniref:BZ3500_MvSof-1268-A1-R1_Chr8-1g09839 protein n=1 Tax=Microbotryum saponariae TaxID=289078 RepID=A0A2X0KPT1_9BASI|nr:BZ3500_MvSof-1268-A1-R1_Chr8-1g09839 [Microbotryum saponariae]SDA08125.1 BZ3501_MvSof-1269-A2-R1_Chr8-1g09562 [Microbotryum saponariae]
MPPTRARSQPLRGTTAATASAVIAPDTQPASTSAMFQSSRPARGRRVGQVEEVTETTAGLRATSGRGRKRARTVERDAEVVEEEVGVPKRMTRAMSASLGLKATAREPTTLQPKPKASKSTTPPNAVQIVEQHPSDQPPEFEGEASESLNSDDDLESPETIISRLSPIKQVMRNVSPRRKRENKEEVEVEVEVSRFMGPASRKRKIEEMQKKKRERNKGMGKEREEEPSPTPPPPPVAPAPVESKGKRNRSKEKLPEPVMEEPEEQAASEAEEEVSPQPQEGERPHQEQDNADEEEEIDQLQSSDSDGEGLVMQLESPRKRKPRTKTYGKKRTRGVDKAQEKTVAKKRIPMKAKTPTQTKSPAKTQTPTKAKSPSKAKSPAKATTSTQASSSTQTKVPRASARKQPARSSQARPVVKEAVPSDNTDDDDDDDDIEYDESESLEIDRPDDPKRPYSFMHVVPQTRRRKEPDWEPDCIWLYPKKWEQGRLERMKQKIEENGGKVVDDLGEATIALFPPVEPLRYNKAVLEALGKRTCNNLSTLQARHLGAYRTPSPLSSDVIPLRSCWVTDSLKLSRRHDVAYRCSLADKQGWLIRPLPPQKARTILQKIDSNSPLRRRTEFTREEVEAFARFKSRFGKLERYKKEASDSVMIRSFMDKVSSGSGEGGLPKGRSGNRLIFFCSGVSQHRTPHTFESWKNFYKAVNNRERVDRLAAQFQEEEREGRRAGKGKGRGRGERRGTLTGWLEAEKGETEEGEQEEEEEENEIVRDDEEEVVVDQSVKGYLVQQERGEESDPEPSPKKRRMTNEPTTPKATPSKDRSPTKNAKLRSSPRKGLQTTPLRNTARDKGQTQASQGRKFQAAPPSSKRSREPVRTRIVDYTSSEEEMEEELPVANSSKKPTSSNPERPPPPLSSQFVPEAFASRAKKFHVPPSTVEAFWFSCTSDWYLVDRLIARYAGRSPSHTEFNPDSSGFESNLWRRSQDEALEKGLSLVTDKTKEECMTRRQFLKDLERYRGLFKYFDEI